MTHRLLIPQTPPPQALPAATGEICVLAGRTMGTAWSVKLCGDMPPQSWLRQDIQQTLDQLDAQMSHWAPDSDLGVYNRRAANSWQPVPEPFFEVLSAALRVATESGGACDPTLGALVNLWGFGPTQKRTTPPSDADIMEASGHCGWQRVQMDDARRRIFQPGGVQLDLSSIAKGYAVDVICGRLLALDLPHFLVEIGGELRGQGCKPDGLPWWVEMEHPDPSSDRTLVALHGLAIATSGDYRQGFEHDGARYSHTLDPRSGRPVRHALASVTVLHESCMEADAQATVLSVLGVQQGMTYADERSLAAVFTSRHADGSYSERISTAAAAMLE